MDPNGRRDKTRRIVIITLSAAIAGLNTALATSYERIGMGLAVLLGYIILFMSAALLNVLLHDSASNTKRMILLVLSICLLMFFLGGITYILFDHKAEEENKADAEISISSALQTRRMTGETDNASSNLQDALPPEDAVNVPENEPPKNDASEIMATYVPDNASSGGAESIIQDNLHNDRAEVPSIPVFIEPNITETKAIIGGADAATDILITDDTDPVSVPDIPVFIEASIKEINEDETPAVPVIIGNADAETDSPAMETASSDNDFFSGLSPEEADFWADFYIAGEDELTLEDGIYYMNLSINGEYTGTIEVKMENDVPSLLTAELHAYLDYTLTNAASARVFSNRGTYITLSELETVGVGTVFDAEAYEVGLFFNVADMPVQILSIRGSGSRAYSRPIAGAFDIEPAVFSLISRYTLNVDFRDVTSPSVLNDLSFSLSSYNNARLYDVRLDFSYYLDFTLSSFDFRLSSYEFYLDFPEQMLRLSWGEVDTDLLSPTGSGIGVRIEKSTAYSDDTFVKSSSLSQMLVIEKASDVEIFNEGQSIFRRTLQPGLYRLQDFILYTGANKILIRVSPLDGSPAEEIEFDVLYSASLLSKGEIYYGAALAFSRSLVSGRPDNEPGAYSLPIWNSRSLRYDFRDAVISGYVRTGLTDTLTLDTSLALQNRPSDVSAWRPNAALAIELTNLNILGTTRYNINVDERSDRYGAFTLPSLKARLSHQISTDIRWLSSVSFGIGYNSPDDWIFSNKNDISLNASFSGSLGILGWSISGYGSFNVADVKNDYSWTVSASLNLPVYRNAYLSASMNVNGSDTGVPSISGRVGATVRFGGVDVSANTGFKDLSVRVSGAYDRHSFSGSIGSGDPANIHSYDLDASYSYAGKRISTGVNLNVQDLADRVGINANISTSTVFADGLFAIASYIPQNYLLVRQNGALSDNTISVGTPRSSSFMPVPTTFGTALYDGVSSYGDTGLVVYSNGNEQFGISESMPVNLRASRRKGYVLRMTAEEEYSVSGIATLDDGTVWINGSSLVYSIVFNEDDLALETTEIYLFTDSDGRFVLSGLKPGYYGFDIYSDGEWYLRIFSVKADPDGYTELQMLGMTEELTGYNIPAPYTGMMIYEYDRNMTAEEFFEMLYPEMKEFA